MLRITDNSPKNENHSPALPPLQELSNLRAHHQVHCYACGKQEGQMMSGRKGAVYYAKFVCAGCGFEFDYNTDYGKGVHPTDLNMAHDSFGRKTMQYFSQLLIGHKEEPEVPAIESETEKVQTEEVKGKLLKFVPRWKKKIPT